MGLWGTVLAVESPGPWTLDLVMDLGRRTLEPVLAVNRQLVAELTLCTS